LVGIKSTLDSILAQLDHELIITAPTVNCATDGANKVSFYTREKIVWDSEAGTQVSRVVEYSLDGEDFTASKPAGTVSVGACVLSGDITDTLVEFQVEDCDGNPVGTPMDALPTIVLNKQIVSICNVQELADAINAGAKDYTSVLESIDTKLDELVEIKDELVTVNNKLDTVNTNLTTIISKLDIQITSLTDIKDAILDGNVILGDILNAINLVNTNLSDIVSSLGETNLKLDTIITRLETITTELQTINTTLQSEFDETQVILNDIKDAILSKGSDCANATFTKDCDRQELLDKLDELKEVEYNINEQWRVTGSTPPAPYDTDTTDGASVTFAAGTYHSWDLVVESGIVKIEIGGKIFSHKKGYSQSYDATTLYTNDIIVTQASDDCVATIVTIK
jgi:hypothetical protein